jgi:hypothetical protein
VFKERTTRACRQAEARLAGSPVPSQLAADAWVFAVPAGLRRTLDRGLRAAGIPKRDDRGRTVDVHAIRTTFGTLLSMTGAAPRTARAAMRHSDIKLTMNVYTDPRLLDVRGAVEKATGSATGEGGGSESACTNSVQAGAIRVTCWHFGIPDRVVESEREGRRKCLSCQRERPADIS